ARILDGDDRLRGEVLHQLDLPIGERLDMVAPDEERSDRGSFAHQRRGKLGPVPILLRIGRSLWKFALGRLQIADMNRFAINYRSSRDPTAVYRPRRSYTPYRELRRGPMPCNGSQYLTLYAHDVGVGYIEQSASRCYNGVQYRLDLGWRAGDDTQKLRGGTLLPQRLLQPVLEQRNPLGCIDRERLATYLRRIAAFQRHVT